ncbi:MAG TPA: AMP-binding protein, partial [Acidimicrobiia bacterium]|nr:AMP-binding protein [Acidimicrobiia bacterium]
ARRLLERAATNPFYRPRLAAAGVSAERLTDLARWRDVPIVDKAALVGDQEEHPPFGRRLGVDPAAVRQLHLTSGTSGFGQEAFALSDGDLDVSGSTWRWCFDDVGLRPGQLFVTFYPVTFLAYGRSVLEGSRVSGVPVFSMAGVDRSLALGLLRRLQPTALGARPALFGLLAEELDRHGISPREAFPTLSAVVCSGIAPGVVAATEAEWDVTVHEVYGSSQAGGLIASTGPEGAAPEGSAGVMRLMEPHFLVEAVDPETLEPVEEGEAELLLTCLDRIASPVIRFRTRDRVQIVPAGSYGERRPLRGIRCGAVDRFDDMLKIRGNNVWPAQLDEALLAHPSIADYRADVTLDSRAVDVLTVRVRPVSAVTGDGGLEAELQRRVKLATNVTPTIEWVPDLPVPEMKPRRLADRRQR